MERLAAFSASRFCFLALFDGVDRVFRSVHLEGRITKTKWACNADTQYLP